MISDSCEVKIVESADAIYCVDVRRPAVLKISPEIRHLLTEGIGKPEKWIRDHVAKADEAILAINQLQGKGFLVEPPQNLPQPPTVAVSKIALEVSGICNLGCKYCYSDSSDSRAGSALMSADMGKGGHRLLLQSRRWR